MPPLSRRYLNVEHPDVEANRQLVIERDAEGSRELARLFVCRVIAPESQQAAIGGVPQESRQGRVGFSS